MLELERAQRAVLKVLLEKPRRFTSDELFRVTGVSRVYQLSILGSLLNFIKTEINCVTVKEVGK